MRDSPELYVGRSAGMGSTPMKHAQPIYHEGTKSQELMGVHTYFRTKSALSMDGSKKEEDHETVTNEKGTHLGLSDMHAHTLLTLIFLLTNGRKLRMVVRNTSSVPRKALQRMMKRYVG